MEWLLLYPCIGALIWLYTDSAGSIEYFLKCVFGWAFYAVAIIFFLIFDRR